MKPRSKIKPLLQCQLVAIGTVAALTVACDRFSAASQSAPTLYAGPSYDLDQAAAWLTQKVCLDLPQGQPTSSDPYSGSNPYGYGGCPGGFERAITINDPAVYFRVSNPGAIHDTGSNSISVPIKDIF